MIVALDKLTNAMLKVKSFAQDIKTVPGVLLNLGDNQIEVCYSDGKKSIIEKVDAIMQQGEQLGQIVVPYQVFMDMISICQPSGTIICDDLTITVKENNILSVETIKYAIVSREVGDSTEEEKKPVSKFKQEIKYYRADEDIRYGILSRMDYDSIFNSEKFDVWDKSRLQETLNKLNKEDGKVCYFSSQIKAAFVTNVDHTICIPRDEIEENGFSLTSKMARYIVEILNKTDADKVQVAVEDMRYCKITTPDETVGIWFEMAPAVRMDFMTLQSYEAKQYAQYQLVFNRHALQDAIKRAISGDNANTTSLTFTDTEDGLIVNIVHGGSASKSKDFYVIAEAYKDTTGKILETKIPVSLKAISDIIDICSGDYLLIDITDDESGKYLRCKDVVDRDEEGNIVVGSISYTLSAK